MRFARVIFVSCSITLALGTSAWATGLTIIPTFDTSVTSSPNAAGYEAATNAAIGLYESLFTNPITVNILFRYSTTLPNGACMTPPCAIGGVAESETAVYTSTWSTYLTDLKTNLTANGDSNAVTAANNLPSTALATDIITGSAGGRAVGLATPGDMRTDGTTGVGGTFDGIVTLDSALQFSFNRSTGFGSQFDALSALEHEMDEVLGLGSILNTTVSTSTAWRPQDLYRYSAPGTRSVSAAAGSAYFSIDGGNTDIVNFNQNGGADFGDWLDPSCPANPYLVQNAVDCQVGTGPPNQYADISAVSPEGVTLDVLGYDLSPAAAPEPGSILLMASGILLLAALRRRAAIQRS
jgi:hypothetical protein